MPPTGPVMGWGVCWALPEAQVGGDWPQSHTGPPWATQMEAEREGGCASPVSTPHPWGPLGADILVPRLKEQGVERWKSER